MAQLTKQGLRNSLLCAVEFGYKSAERGENIQKCMDSVKVQIEELVNAAENCPTEIMRIDFRKPKGKKISYELRDKDGKFQKAD